MPPTPDAMKDFLKNLDLSKDELPANAKGVDVEKVPVKVDKIDVGVSNLLNIIKFYYNAIYYLVRSGMVSPFKNPTRGSSTFTF